MENKDCTFCFGFGYTVVPDGQAGSYEITCTTCFGYGEEREYTMVPVVGTPEFLRET